MTKLLCACKPRIERPMAANVGPERASMVAVHDKLWASGTRLRYWIDPGMTGADRDVLHRSFSQWDSLVGLSIEVSSYRTNADSGRFHGFPLVVPGSRTHRRNRCM